MNDDIKRMPTGQVKTELATLQNAQMPQTHPLAKAMNNVALKIKSHQIPGYYKKNGQYVAPYNRSR